MKNCILLLLFLNNSFCDLCQTYVEYLKIYNCEHILENK